MKRGQKPLSLPEFTALVALMISIVAMATDIMPVSYTHLTLPTIYSV